MKPRPPNSTVIIKPKPKKTPPQLRLGGSADAQRQKKAQAQHARKSEAKIRVHIYRDLLALLNISERLTLDLSGHQDRFGIEWLGLARHIFSHYNADLIDIIPELQDKIMSKEGARGLPQGLYRQLLDFAGECDEFLKTTRSVHETPPDKQGADFLDACEHFKKTCNTMRQNICIFENERPPSEESFFE
ncbi:MAG: hypothetical protein PHI93_00625 [Kiritimatiellae bacterium]|jgi:hypothetical protein|nr:hypothetical protein [Kiritimatiellia bacterium]MDY0150263.1 hypothetical protein [Kiritimatiellia bacterium]